MLPVKSTNEQRNPKKLHIFNLLTLGPPSGQRALIEANILFLFCFIQIFNASKFDSFPAKRSNISQRCVLVGCKSL